MVMLLVSLGALSSCASTIQTYEGGPKDKSQIAIVSATNGATVTRSTMIHSVDGVRGPNFVYGHYVYNNANFAADLVLLPGEHTLEVSYGDNPPFPISFTAEKGKRYRIVPDKRGAACIRIVDISDGSDAGRGCFVAYVEPAPGEESAVLFYKGGVLTTFAEATPILFKIDDTWGRNGVRGRYYFNNTVNGSFSIHATPGKHTLEIGMVKRGLVVDKYATAPKSLDVELEAGKEYILVIDLQKETWTPLCVEVE